MITAYLLKALQTKRTEIRDSAQGVELTIVTRTVSGTLGDYYKRGKKYTESTTVVQATGGFNTGYTYDDTVGGVVENSGVAFELSGDYATTLRAEHTYVRYESVNYAIDSVNILPDTNEVIISCSRLK